MPSVYGDISSGNNVLAAACYLGHDDQWEIAKREWAAIIGDAGISHFHATDFYNCRKAFEGWELNGDKQVDFAKRFCAVADDAGLIGFAYVMDLPAFREILAPELEKEQRIFKSSHERCYAAMGAVAAVNDFLAKTSYRTKQSIPIVFEAEKGAGRFVQFFEESQKRKERWTWWFRSFDTGPKDVVPCQMADLLAHESWRRGSAILQESDREIRKSLKRMLQREHIDLRLFNWEHAKLNASLVREGLAKYPNGLMPPDTPTRVAPER
jgi:hypothetical protein